MTCSLQRIVLLYCAVEVHQQKKQSGEAKPPRSALPSDLAINLLYQSGALFRMGLGNPTFTVDLAL